jgi:hypothetical protein
MDRLGARDLPSVMFLLRGFKMTRGVSMVFECVNDKTPF